MAEVELLQTARLDCNVFLGVAVLLGKGPVREELGFDERSVEELNQDILRLDVYFISVIERPYET